MDSLYLQALNHGYDLVATHQTIAEWSFNDLFSANVVNDADPNNTAWKYTKIYFPPSSVATGYRPNSGIFYGFTNQAYTSSSNNISGKRYYSAAPIPSQIIDTGLTTNQPPSATQPGPSYTYYQYWASPDFSSMQQADADLSNPAAGYPIDLATLSVNYTDENGSSLYVNANKIKVTFNLGPMPTDWDIYVYPQGATGWVLAASNPTVDPNTGVCELWWSGSAWTATMNIADAAGNFQISKGVKVVINKIDTPGERVMLTEVSHRRQIDMTDRIESWEYDYAVDHEDFMHPVGDISASTGKITISNSDLSISEHDTTKEFYGLLVGWCKWESNVIFDLTEYNGGLQYKVTYRIGTMYTNDFEQQDEYTYSIELFDIIKRMQITPCHSMLRVNETLGSILSQIFDNLGIDCYDFSSNTTVAFQVIPYFWTDGTQMVYDALVSLLGSNQATLWQNELGIITARSRNDIANDTDSPTWTFKGTSDGTRLADLVTIQKQYTLQANDVLVQYSQYTPNAPQGSDVLTSSNVNEQDRTNTGLTSSLYQSSDTIAIRATSMAREMLKTTESSTSTYWDNRDVWVASSEAENWPFKGKVNIDGEYISYNGKGYGYYTYNSTTATWTYAEATVYSSQDQQNIDQTTWNSFKQVTGLFISNHNTPEQEIVTGGVSTDPSKQNGYTGRLVVNQRDLNSAGEGHHGINWKDGWVGLNGWWFDTASPVPSGRFFEGNGTNLTDNLSQMLDWRNKPNWHNPQFKWTWKNSILTCNNLADGASPRLHSAMYAPCVRDLGDTEYREMGTRLRMNQDGCAGIVFYLSNAVGYDYNNVNITNPTAANRCYILYITTSSLVDAGGRTTNEIAMAVKNHANLTNLPSTNYFQPLTQDTTQTPGKFEIDPGVWYDVDLIFHEEFDSQGNAISAFIDVLINGQWVNSFHTTDVIRPTSWSGVFARYACTVDFEYFYGTNDGTYSRSKNMDGDLFTFETTQLPPGTNITKALNIPTGNSWLGAPVASFATTSSNATLSSVRVLDANGHGVNIGPITLNQDDRPWVALSDIITYPSLLVLTYTSTTDLSVCLEYSRKPDFPYNYAYNTSVDDSVYDLLNQYSSNRVNELLLNLQTYDQYSPGELDNVSQIEVFFDDFGAYVHEVRDLNVPFDTSPAEGVNVFCSNNNIKVVDFTYNPSRGICTLANTSHQTEIANGTQQIDANNTTNQSLLFYGYALVNQGSRYKEVKDPESIRRHGAIQQTLNATWVFNDNDAQALGEWITSHWSEPMDTIKIEVWGNAAIQIGDKVSIDYAIADVDSSWLFWVTDSARIFDNNAFVTTLTLQRVR